jgi:hypothetical protein
MKHVKVGWIMVICKTVKIGISENWKRICARNGLGSAEPRTANVNCNLDEIGRRG